MKALMYGWEFPPNINGGLGIACYEIVQALLRQNVRVHLILPQAQQLSSPTHLNKLNIQFINALLQPYMNKEEYQTKKAEFSNPQLHSSAKRIYADDLFGEVLRYAHLAGQLAEQIQHDFIHAHDWLTIQAGMVAKQISKKPLLFHVHSLEIDRAGENANPTITKIEQLGLQTADKIIAVSEYTRQKIIHHYHISADKIIVAYNAIPSTFVQSFNQSVGIKKNKSVLFLGRITYQKGPFYFIEAAQKILSLRQDIRFIIAGDGDLLPSLKAYVTQHKLEPWIEFLGFIDRKQIPAVYQRSDMYVMPSVSEPFGLTCLEALTYNIPVLLSKQAGVAEVLPHVLKIDFWDIDAMAEKIMALIDYPALGLTSLQNSKRDLLKLNWDMTATKILEAYQVTEEV